MYIHKKALFKYINLTNNKKNCNKYQKFDGIIQGHVLESYLNKNKPTNIGTYVST